jgi:hypothetical protein
MGIPMAAIWTRIFCEFLLIKKIKDKNLIHAESAEENIRRGRREKSQVS